MLVKITLLRVTNYFWINIQINFLNKSELFYKTKLLPSNNCKYYKQ